jgi:hypothetical protein
VSLQLVTKTLTHESYNKNVYKYKMQPSKKVIELCILYLLLVLECISSSVHDWNERWFFVSYVFRAVVSPFKNSKILVPNKLSFNP